MDRIKFLMSLSGALGRRLDADAAALLVDAIPSNVEDDDMAVAANRMVSEYDRFVFRDFLVVVNEVRADRPVSYPLCKDPEAAMRRIRKAMDIPEPDEELGDDE